MMQFVDLNHQYQRYKQAIEKRMAGVFSHGKYILGPEVEELEAKLAAFTGVRHCIGVASGTDALLMALMALGIGKDDEVITSPFSFIATAEVIALLGAKPVYVDIEADTFNLDASKIEAAITSRTRVIVPVSLYGQCADFNGINRIADKHGFAVIEDGAQSFGAEYHGGRSCGLSYMGCTSFFPSKPLGGYGDGGAIFTNDEQLAKQLRMIRAHGQDKRYHHACIGINGRLDTLQAAIVLAKFEGFEQEITLRNQVAERYSNAFNKAGIKTPVIRPGNKSVFAQYTIQVDNREIIAQSLQNDGIPTAVHYPVPLYKQPALLQDGVELENTEYASQHVLSLPMHPYLTQQDQDSVIDAVIRYCRN